MKIKGFSLVEMLVAMTILSMMTLIASSMFATFANKWEGQLGKFDKMASVTKSSLAVFDIINNITPYVVQLSNGRVAPYFEGNENGFVAVSQRSLFNGATPAVVRLSAVQDADFKYQLLYEEWPMYNSNQLQVGAVLPFSPPVQLESQLADIRFNYYGAEKEAEVFSMFTEVVKKSWSTTYNALETSVQPEKIKVDIYTTAEDYFTFYVTLTEMAPARTRAFSFGEAKKATDDVIEPF